MNVNENKLKENNLNEMQAMAASSLNQPQISPIKTNDSSFEDEFNKLLNSNFGFDPSSMISGIMPVDYSIMPIDYSATPNDYETVSLDTNNIENVDAMFYLSVANQGESVNISINNETSVIDANNYKTMEVSKTLGNMLMKAAENNKTLRLDFDNNVTVILKVAADGKIDASFIPQNREVENYLKNNIDYLKVRFDEQTIAYSNISYKPYKQPGNGRQKEERQGKKE